MTYEETVVKSLGEIIHRVRKERQITQDNLGKMAGTSQMTIQRVEAAFGGIRIETLISIANALNIRLTDLFHEIETKNATKKKADVDWDYVAARVSILSAEDKMAVTEIIDKVLNIVEKK